VNERYTWPAILLHWLEALLVVWLLWLGWTMVDLPKGAERSAAYGLHKSLGLLVLLATLLRLAWRAGHPPPQQGRQAAMPCSNSCTRPSSGVAPLWSSSTWRPP